MIRKSTVTLLILLISIGISFAQNTKQLVFAYQYLPNKTYTLVTTNTTEMRMNAEGMQKSADSVGSKKQMLFNMIMDMNAKIVTGKPNQSKDIPFTMSYDKFTMSMEVDGKKMDQPMPSFANTKMEGVIKQGIIMQIDSISGLQKKDEAMKKMLQEMVGKMQQSIKFPSRPVKIGDTFNMVTPFKLPMQGMGNMEMNIHTNYLLKEIKDGKAYLGITQTLSMDLDNGEKAKMKATGNGIGTAIYEIAKKFITTMDMDMKMHMNVENPEGGNLMDMNMINKTAMKVLIN